MMKRLIFLLIFYATVFPVMSQVSFTHNYQKVLVIKKRYNNDKLKDSLRTAFIVGNNVKVRDKEGRLYIGYIKEINDSAVFVKDKQIPIDQIKSICRADGIWASIIGGSIVMVGVSSILTIVVYSNLDEENEFGLSILGVVAGEFLIGLVGLIPTTVGLVRQISTKHFQLGEKWQLCGATMDVLTGNVVH